MAGVVGVAGILRRVLVQLRIFTEPQVGASYADLLAAARATEDGGFDGFFRSDHLMAFGGEGLPGSTDAWLTLAGLARETRRVRLGTLVSAVTFRFPGLLALGVAQVDTMSDGRVELGLGTGWFEREHAAYGIPFPELRLRFEMLEEQLQIVRGMWETPLGECFSFSGNHYRLSDSPALPKPAQSPRPPLIVGGIGPRRTPALAARYADEYNVPFSTVENVSEQYERVDAACQQIGRAPDSLIRSAALTIACGRDADEVGRRARAAGRDPDNFGRGGISGSPAEIVDGLGRYADAGASRFYLQLIDLRDLAHIELLAAEVLRQV